MTQTVRNLTVVACDVMRYSELPKKFWHAHTVSTKWIQNVRSIVFKHSTLYETGKSNAEETLIKAINALNDELNRFVPNLTFLDRIDDIEKLNEYKLVMYRQNHLGAILLTDFFAAHEQVSEKNRQI